MHLATTDGGVHEALFNKCWIVEYPVIVSCNGNVKLLSVLRIQNFSTVSH